MARRVLIPVGCAALAVFCLAAGEPDLAASAAAGPSDAERANRTMADLRNLAMAIEEYRVDNGQYPPAESIQELQSSIQPVYIRTAPATDAWGSALRYQLTADRRDYLLVSAGADRVFDETSWSREGKNSGFGEDTVMKSGKLVKFWRHSAAADAPADAS